MASLNFDLGSLPAGKEVTDWYSLSLPNGNSSNIQGRFSIKYEVYDYFVVDFIQLKDVVTKTS